MAVRPPAVDAPSSDPAPHPEEARDLALAMHRGESAALEALVGRYMARALHVATLILQDVHWAEDAVAEAFLAVWRYGCTYDPALPFLPWFDRIVARSALRLARQARRAPASPVDDAADLSSEPLEDHFERLELRLQVLRAVRELPDALRAAVVLKYVVDMTDAEIARATGTPLGTVKWRLASAKRLLRSSLASLAGYEVATQESGGGRGDGRRRA